MTKSALTHPHLAQPGYHQLLAKEERLLRRNLEQDPHQVQQLVEVFLKRLYQHAFLHLGDELRAEALCRKTFDQVLDQTLDGSLVQSTQPLGQQIYQLLRSELANENPPATSWAEAEEKTDPEHQADRERIRAFRQLPFELREVLVLAVYERRSAESLADFLATSTEQITERLQQAGQQLQLEDPVKTMQKLLDRLTAVRSDFKHELEIDLMQKIETQTGQKRVALTDYDAHDAWWYRLRWLLQWPQLLIPLGVFVGLMLLIHQWLSASP